MTLDEKITQLRKEKHLSQEELAEAMQVSRQAISKWENGSARPNLKTLTRLAEYFEVDVNVLLCQQPQAQPGESGPGQGEPAATSKIRRLKWIAAVLALTTALFAGLWIYEIQNGQREEEPVSAQMNRYEHERWPQIKMFRYIGPVCQEIALSDSDKRELANRIWNTSFHKAEATDPGDQEIIYGALRIEVAFVKNNVEHKWLFHADHATYIVTTADSAQMKYEYQEDDNLFQWLKTFL